MATSDKMIGSISAWAAGYTGAGSKVAIIDTGADTDHPSLDPDAFSYAVKDSGAALMTAADTEKVLSQLNASKTKEAVTAEQLYVNAKIPFGFNYVDEDLDITHDNDTEGDHGSHVTGIAAGNRYIANGDGTFSKALDSVLTQGVAPDAQVLTMKVFGKGGGAYDSDYMAAIEDAMVLGADSANLSLGSANPGFSHCADTVYEQLLKRVTESGMVVAMSAGNSGNWFESTNYTYPYAESASWATAGSPGSYTNSLAVASVDNVGLTGNYIEFAGTRMFYNDTTEAPIQPMTALAGKQRFVYVDAFGKPEDFAAVGDALKGAIALCNRGSLNFTDKGNNAIAAGAIATIVVNNEAGVINMATDGYNETAPYVSLTLADGQTIKANAEKKEANGVTYYVGTMTVGSAPAVNDASAEYYTMSDFSSWGVPGSLELKPEITAPGGSIYSLMNGGGYQNMSGTSMASPQVAGMAALVAQYIKENNLTAKTGLTARVLAQSLLMSTAEPLFEDYGEYGDGYYPVLRQGAGLANVGAAISSGSYLLMDSNATDSYKDGKIKVELGDDPDRNGLYTFGFTIYNMEDTDTAFNLDADFFTQDVFPQQFKDGSVVNFEDTYTTPIAASINWDVDGKTLDATDASGMEHFDFNGDGKINNDDGQALLDYVTGVREKISNKDYADFDSDGGIDTYDAYLFFKRLGKSAVVVPANDSVHVSVTVQLSKAMLSEIDAASKDTGTYVEGYVFASELTSAEGELGTQHSIPVLGYYGSWSEPSMFDIGSYLEYHKAGTESRAPYMYAANKNATKYQSLLVQYAGDNGLYYFGANPYVTETYDPERAAINPETTSFARATFSLIRNAADSRVTISGEDGTSYYDKIFGTPTISAFYYTNGRTWRNAQSYISINNAPTAAKEGEKITVKITEAPEYYVSYDAAGNPTTAWDALSDGASQSYTAYIDKSEPVLSDVSFKENVESGARTLSITAKDNRYVAAAFLIDYDEMEILDRTAGSPEGAALGSTVDLSLDMSKAANVDHLYIQVCDYADNTATYKINLNKEELDGPVSVALDKSTATIYRDGTVALTAEVSPFGVKPDGVTWSSDNEAVATVNANGVVTGISKGSAVITAASIKDPTAKASCVVTVITVDTTLVGALMDAKSKPQFYTWDMENDAAWKPYVDIQTLSSISATTFDARNEYVFVEDGNGYDLHKVDLDTGKVLADYPGFEDDIPIWDMEYSLVYSTEENPLLSSVYYIYFMPNKSPSNLDTSAFDFSLYLAIYGGASYFTAITSLGTNKIDIDEDGVKETTAELFLLLDNAGNIWTMNTFPTVDEDTGEDTWDAYFGIFETNLTDVGYAPSPTDDGDLYDSFYATVEGDSLVLYLTSYAGDTSNVFRITQNERGAWEGAKVASFGDGIWPATLIGSIYHENNNVITTAIEAMEKTEMYTAQAVELTADQIARYGETSKNSAPATGSLNAAPSRKSEPALPLAAPVEKEAAVSNVTVSDDEKTVTVNIVAKSDDATTNGLATVDFDSDVLTLTDVSMFADYTSHKDEDGKVTLGYVDVDAVPVGTVVATLTFSVDTAKAGKSTEITVHQTELNNTQADVTESLTADLHEDTEVRGAKDPTCTEKGYTGDTYCKACNALLEKGKDIDALGHDYKNGKCTRCGEKQSNVKTGDESGLNLWFVILTMSAAVTVLAAAVLLRKKRKN